MSDGTLPISTDVLLTGAKPGEVAARLNNVLCYFLGLITFFASRLLPNATTFSELSGAVVIGLIAGGVTFLGQRRLMKI